MSLIGIGLEGEDIGKLMVVDSEGCVGQLKLDLYPERTDSDSDIEVKIAVGVDGMWVILEKPESTEKNAGLIESLMEDCESRIFNIEDEEPGVYDAIYSMTGGYDLDGYPDFYGDLRIVKK